MTERVERRVARALLRLVHDAGRRVDVGIEIDFPVSRQDIAEMTGTMLYTVSRMLSAWEKHGIVRSGRQRIILTKPHALVATPADGASRGSTDPSRAGVIRRIEAEYREIPGLRLTTPQASRLWGLNPGQSDRLLSELVDEGFLMRDTRGAYRRRGCPRCS